MSARSQPAISSTTNAKEAESQPSEVSRNRECVIVEPHQGWRGIGFSELWRFRELLFFLTWRDVKVRYKQSLLGACWAVLQPLTYMVLFTFVFGRMAKVPTNGIPYPIFAFSGLLLWMFFANSVGQASNSVVSAGSIITKIYFPRLAIPFASVGALLMDLVISFMVLLVIIAYYAMFPTGDAFSVSIGWQILLVVPITLLAVFAALGIGTILAALNVSFRDIKHTIPFLMQAWMFATPTIYMGSEHKAEGTSTTSVAETPLHASVSDSGKSEIDTPTRPSDGAVPDVIQNLLVLNPLTGIISSFRAAVLNQPMPWKSLAYSTTVVVVCFFMGCFYFRRVEDTFADIV